MGGKLRHIVLTLNLCPQMPLTDIACKSAKPSDKPRKMSDANGLYLEIMPNGRKYWRLKYRFAQKEKRLAIGIYPEVSLSEAHHALANAFTLCINHLKPKHLIGMTAAPWRGDDADIESVFGETLDPVSLVDGMKMGFLSSVDYRLM